MKDKTIHNLLSKLQQEIEQAGVEIVNKYLNKTVTFVGHDHIEKTGKVIFATLDISFARWFEVLGNNHKRITNSTTN